MMAVSHLSALHVLRSGMEKVCGYGRELALHKLCEEIDFISIINRHGYKCGGPELGEIVEAMAIARNCDPFSYFQ